MFECTNIATCILVLDKNKTTAIVEMIDARERYVEEIRLQNGQYGSKSHTNRTYEKKVRVFSDETIEEILSCIKERKNIKGFCKAVTIEEIKKKDYRLIGSMYFEVTIDDFEISNRRSYEDINNVENRYLCELRDALLPDLMSGKIDIKE